jgi:hypothetical protein
MARRKSKVDVSVEVETQKRAIVRLTGFLIIPVLWGVVLGQSVQAEPVVQVLFGGDECSFLPEQPPPLWVTSLPSVVEGVPVIAGVGSADRMSSNTDQIQMAEQNARAALAAGIEVRVKEEVKVFIDERYGSSKKGISHTSEQQISLEARQVVDQTLSGSQIKQKYLDRKNCVVYALAIVSKAELEESKRKFAEQLRRQFKRKQLMLLDQSKEGGEAVIATRGMLEGLFEGIGNSLLDSAAGASCANDSMKPVCKDVIYAEYTVALEDKQATPAVELWTYRLAGKVRFKERLIASFNVLCQERGNAGQEYKIARKAAEACIRQARQTIERGMQGSE